jgi:hypothetical protein
MAQVTPTAQHAAGPSTLRAKLHLARGARRRNTKTLLRSRAGRPLRRNSNSIEGWMPPRAKLRLDRGLDAPSGETLPRSRAGRPLGRNSTSIEGWTPPRAKLCLDRGLDAPSGETAPCSRAIPHARLHLARGSRGSATTGL